MFTYICTAQSGIITYKVLTPELKKDTDDRVKQVNIEIDLMSFTLTYDAEKSYFIKNRNIPQDKYHADIASILVKSSHSYFQYLVSKTSLYNYDIKDKTYIVSDNSKMQNWNLTNETRMIEGYTCYKATLKTFNERSQKEHIREAWYTPEIPVPYGPVSYGGLPGLILEIKINHGFVYYATKIVKNKPVKLPKLKEGPEISPKEMVILMRKARKVTED